MKYAIALHGGAGDLTRKTMTPEKELAYTSALREAANIGYNVLSKGGSALDAVEETVKNLEDCILFNAGKGSVFNSKGEHEMDASIMWGKDLSAGAVTLLKNVRNPVALVRAIMEKSPFVFLGGAGAEEFAKSIGTKFEPTEYFYYDLRDRQLKKQLEEGDASLDHNTEDIALNEKKFGTVGAVAIDKQGNLAAATSTGGMTNKKFGRIGDSPIIGAGTYANNNTCAVSCTGHGEFFIRAAAAHSVSCLMEYKNISLHEACHEVVMNKLLKLGGEGGLIAVDKNGNVEFAFNSEGMYRAMKDSEGNELVKIYRD